MVGKSRANRRDEYNERCQYREKTFQSFYARRHELINVAFTFHIVDGVAKSPARVSAKFYYSAETNGSSPAFHRLPPPPSCRDFVGIYSDMRYARMRFDVY